MTILFIFRRDLRAQDNTGLNEAIRKSKELNTNVLGVFIFTPEQVQYNKFKSDTSVEFMMNCLEKLPVQTFYGSNLDVLAGIIKKISISHIFFNRDTTHYAIKRDKDIQKFCNNHEISCEMFQDYNLLDNLLDVKSLSDEYYTVYTPFMKKSKTFDIRQPKTEKVVWYTDRITSKYSIDLDKARKKFVEDPADNMLVTGGRLEAMNLLKRSTTEQKKYSNTRDKAYKSTTLLSAHIKFGTLSIREVYYHFKKNKMTGLIDQLFWNEYYDYLMLTLPKSKTIGGSNFKGKVIDWENDTSLFEKWKEGKTGFPFIDAGMRQINSEGYMHNRARMAVANFLVMILHIDWRWGEKYFATKLVDYDVAQNNGNWQWSTGVGVDRTGYTRIFNPFTQSKNHDDNCEYIKKYIPELKDVPNSAIHKWETEHTKYDNYVSPTVEYKERRQRAIEKFTN